jgi:uncharacterized FlaG/YvyC family protein
MTKRSGIPKNVRFGVFKRDLFTCQYCGRKSPEVVLELDHIKPVCKGGDNSVINLITSCFDCNRGKKGEALSENMEIKKQESELADQFQKMQEFIATSKIRDEAIVLDDKIKKYVCAKWCKMTNWEISEIGQKKALALVKKYGLAAYVDAMETSVNQYFDQTNESAEKTFKFIAKILNVRRLQQDNPELSEIYYIRGIIVKRFGFLESQKWQIASDLKAAMANGYDAETLKDLAKHSSNYTEYRIAMEEMVKK